MGKYSSDSDSADSYRKSKKKSRHRSSSSSSSSSRYSSSRSRRKKCVRKHKKRGRSRSKDKDRRSKSSRKYSRDRDRDRHSKRSRSRSHSYSATQSPARNRHRSKDSDSGSTRRSRSRDRRRHRSRSRSHSRRRSRSKDRRLRDDGAELLEKLNKAAIQAMADNSKLREATLNLVNQVAERESAILEIKASSFAPKSFSSTASDKRTEDLPIIMELPEPKPVKINLSMREDPNSLLHPNLLLEDADEKLNRWVRKIYLIRQRTIRGEPLTAYG